MLWPGNSAFPTVPDRDESLEGALVDRSLTFPNGAVAVWKAGRRFSYTASGGGREWVGRYTISAARVCVEFRADYGEWLGPGWGAMATCFRVIRNEDRYVLMNNAGRAFPLARTLAGSD